ncbi:MAG: division/cell wall cluster transcriptional repressor MraZ [Treponema sp.]|jgi:MraZ protein|nr:division/cell wall cluster transcriptional repressor MraZ [Treponema sp.]
MEMLIGQYRNTLDEKGRILFPAKLRSILQKDELIVTQGLDHCLMLFTTEEWISLNDKIMGAASLFNDQKRLVMRRFIAPAQKLEFDRSGRLSIPQNLREYASLKGECIIQGLNKYMELWDSASYAEYLEKSEDSFQDAVASMDGILF